MIHIVKLVANKTLVDDEKTINRLIRHTGKLKEPSRDH